MPGRLVVVVLVADRLGGQARRLERVARADPRRDEQVQHGPWSGRRSRRSARPRRACPASRGGGHARRRRRVSSGVGRPCGPLVVGGSRSRSAGVRPDDPGRIGDRSPRVAGRCRGLYAGTPATDVDAQIADAEAAGRRREGRQELGRRAAAAPGRRSGRRPRRRPRSPRAGRPGRRPAAAGTRSATSASNVAIARASRSSSSRPRARAASGMRSPSRTIGRRRGLTASAPPAAGSTAVADEPAPPASPPGPPRCVAIARSAGSRSSSVVVVTNAWGSSAIRRTRCARRSGSSSREDVVEQQERRAAVLLGQQVELGELEGEDRRPLLAARGEPRQVAAGQLEREVVAVRADRASRRSRPPSRRSRRAAGRARRGASRRARPARSSTYRSVRRAGGGLLGGDLGVGRAPAARRARSSSAQPVGDDPPAGVEERAVPEAQLVAARRPPRGSRAAARCAAGASAPYVRARSRSPGRAAPASWSRAARRSDGDPTTRSISSGANTTTRSGPSRAPARRPTPLTRIRLRPPVAAGARSATTATSIVVAADVALDRGRGRCPSGSARRRPRSGGSGPRRAARSPRAGWSCRPRSGPRRAAARARRRPRARRSPGGRAG